MLHWLREHLWTPEVEIMAPYDLQILFNAKNGDLMNLVGTGKREIMSLLLLKP